MKEIKSESCSSVPVLWPSVWSIPVTQEPIRCIDCDCIIAQYEHYYEGGTEDWGYRDTVERASSADSLRCGKCYRKFARLE
jgi:hypothetical protein